MAIAGYTRSEASRPRKVNTTRAPSTFYFVLDAVMNPRRPSVLTLCLLSRSFGRTRVLHSQVYYMEGKTVKSMSLPDMSLAAAEAKELQIHDLMKPLPGIPDMTLVSSYSGYEGEILSATGSTDTSGN